jgi:hypothetical protein
VTGGCFDFDQKSKMIKDFFFGDRLPKKTCFQEKDNQPGGTTAWW